MITGVNHITIAVKSLERSLEFYASNLKLVIKAKWNNGAYLTAGDTWICLSCDDSCPSKDYSHIAFSIDQSEFNHFSKSLMEAGVENWKENTSEGSSVYILDPDGHKLEIHVGDLETRLEELKESPYSDLVLY